MDKVETIWSWPGFIVQKALTKYFDQLINNRNLASGSLFASFDAERLQMLFISVRKYHLVSSK